MNNESFVDENDGNVWISCLMVITWFAFLTIIGGGLWLTNYFAEMSKNETMVWIIWIIGIYASLVVAFLTVAPAMVYLNLAKDVLTIKNILAQKG